MQCSSLIRISLAGTTCWCVTGCGSAQCRPAPETEVQQFCREWRVFHEENPDDKALAGVARLCDALDEGRIREEDMFAFCGRTYEEKLEIVDLPEYCTASPPGDMPTYDERLAVLSVRDAEGRCTESLTVFTAECGDGTRVVATFDGFHFVMTFHENATGRLLGYLNRVADAPIPPCCGLFYWPEPFVCENGHIVEVVCGSYGEPGEAFSLPR